MLSLMYLDFKEIGYTLEIYATATVYLIDSQRAHLVIAPLTPLCIK